MSVTPGMASLARKTVGRMVNTAVNPQPNATFPTGLSGSIQTQLIGQPHNRARALGAAGDDDAQ